MIVTAEFMADQTALSTLDLFDPVTGAKTIFKKSDLRLQSPIWLPDQSGILVVANGRESNFNRSQIGIISYPQGIYRPITNDTNSYPSISLSADGKTIAAVQSQYLGTLQTATYDGKIAGKPVTISSRPPTNWFGWTYDGKILAEQENGIFQMNADGSNRAPLLHDDFPSFGPISCDHGRYAIFASASRGGGNSVNIWRADAMGGNLKQLTTGTYDQPAMCSPDGKWLVYAGFDAGKFVAKKVPVDGGTPTQLSEALLTCGCVNVSPDGKNLAFQTQPTTGGRVVIKILDFETLAPAKSATHRTGKPSATRFGRMACTPSGYRRWTAHPVIGLLSLKLIASKTFTGLRTARHWDCFVPTAIATLYSCAKLLPLTEHIWLSVQHWELTEGTIFPFGEKRPPSGPPRS
jgi:hypothetical protein